MLRVFTWRSPTSIGSWIVTAGGATALAALLSTEWLGRAARPPGTLAWIQSHRGRHRVLRCPTGDDNEATAQDMVRWTITLPERQWARAERR